MLVINKISGFKMVLEKKFANTGFSIKPELNDPLTAGSTVTSARVEIDGIHLDIVEMEICHRIP